jgi:hypothetical protein
MFGNHISSMHVLRMVAPLLAHINCTALSMVMAHQNLHSIGSPIGKRASVEEGYIKKHTPYYTLYIVPKIVASSCAFLNMRSNLP